MITVTAAEFQRHFGRYQDEALTQPVAITRNGRERLVMMSVDEYRMLKRRSREVIRVEDLSDEDVAQIAKGRLHRRHVFWRSGVSTTSERRHASTGHGSQTVAQERRLARSVGASRRSPRAWRYQLQALTSDRRRPQLTQQAPHRESRRGRGR